MTKPLNRVAFVVSVVWEFTHKYPQIRQKYRTKYGFVIDFISEGTDGSQRNNRRRRCAAILLPTEQTKTQGEVKNLGRTLISHNTPLIGCTHFVVKSA